jgi:two-component system phosphate regulon sensor histidine kinase PhoR
MFRSIQWRITLSFSLLVLVVMTILGVYLTNHVREVQLNSLRSSLKTQALIVAEVVRPYLADPSERENLKSEINRMGLPVEERITVIDKDGLVIGDSEEDVSIMENHAGRPEFRDALSKFYGESTRYSTTLGINMMYIAVPVMTSVEITGAVRVALPLTNVENMVGSVITSIVIAIVVTVVLVMVSAWLIARLLTKPVREVTEASKKIASGELHQRIGTGAMDETGELARSFNQMSVKLAETMETLSEDRTRLSGILDNIADGVIMTDTEGEVLLANRAIEQIFNVSNKDLVGKPMIEILHDHEIGELMKKCLETDREQVEQFESDHFRRFLRAMAVPVSGRTSKGILILIQDLTEMRALQTMRRELIGNISHDFRTPLAGIKAMVETLRDSAINDEKAARDFLSRIDGEVDRLAQMVAELTELSRIETGKADLNMEPSDLNSLIDEAIEQLEPQAGRKNISITKVLGDLPAVRMDRERIEQVIINLIHNAVKFTGEGGSITITTNADDNAVTVEIADTGIGIAREDLPHIFERFYMADRSRASGGTGMGLAIARHVIEAHDGTIYASSTEGEGSTFTFSLPVQAVSH